MGTEMEIEVAVPEEQNNFGQEEEAPNQIPLDVALKVMALFSPLDKLKLVTNVRTEVVVTADGTNDAPALHEAHVGLSMGIEGTEAVVTGDGTNDAPALHEANVGLSMGIEGTEAVVTGDGTNDAPALHETETYEAPQHEPVVLWAIKVWEVPLHLYSMLSSLGRVPLRLMQPIQSSLDTIPNEYRWKLLLLCLAILHYLMLPLSSQLDGDLLLGAESLNMGKALLKFCPEMAYIMLFLQFCVLYFLLVWRLTLALKYFFILMWLTTILYAPTLAPKALGVGVSMTWGSLKLSFISFITLGALGLFIIFVPLLLTCIYHGVGPNHIDFALLDQV